MQTCTMQNFNILTSLWSLAGWLSEPYPLGNHKDGFSFIPAHIAYNMLHVKSSMNITVFILTRDRQQSKMLITIDECGSKIARNSVFDCHLGDKWQLKTLFLMIFYLPSSIVLTFSIAAYPV